MRGPAENLITDNQGTVRKSRASRPRPIAQTGNHRVPAGAFSVAISHDLGWQASVWNCQSGGRSSSHWQAVTFQVRDVGLRWDGCGCILTGTLAPCLSVFLRVCVRSITPFDRIKLVAACRKPPLSCEATPLCKTGFASTVACRCDGIRHPNPHWGQSKCAT